MALVLTLCACGVRGPSMKPEASIASAPPADAAPSPSSDPPPSAAAPLAAAPPASEAAGGGASAVIATSTTPANPLARPVDHARVARVLGSLSTRERVAQLMVTFPQRTPGSPVEVGGVLLGGHTLRDVDDARRLVESLRSRARIAPFVAVDMEGGRINRMKTYPGLDALPGGREMGALSDAEVQAIGRRVGEAMRDIGLNMNLAPMLDVASSGHMARNGRAFSGDPDTVVARASAFARGLLEAGVVPIGKHYPGYGDADGDSDHALVEVATPRATLDAHASLFSRAAPVLGGVMMANLVYSEVDNAPAILSATLVAEAHARGFITMTDDISIRLLAKVVKGSGADVLRRAFLAGNDLFLTTAPPDWDKAIDYIGILERLASTSPANAQRAEDACRRVLELKDRLGLLDGL